MQTRTGHLSVLLLKKNILQDKKFNIKFYVITLTQYIHLTYIPGQQRISSIPMTLSDLLK